MAPASKLLVKLSQKLFPVPSDRQQFIEALTQPQPFSPCILWCRSKPSDTPFSTEPPIAWQPDFIDRLQIGEKPGQHPLHQQGYFYCLDFSSVFAISTLLSLDVPVQSVIDVCASPGGKSIFAWVLLQPSYLISNEVIGKRLGALISNFKRCHVQPATVLNLDSSLLAEQLPRSTDVVLVDAPCTGQSLLAKGLNNPGCFHPVTINKNANRQKRILANSAQLVAPQGYLAYMTCAYSIEENEQVSEWLVQQFPQFAPIDVPHLQPYQSRYSHLPCYRMFPQERLGAGAFTILFKNTHLREPQETVIQPLASLVKNLRPIATF
ncbi:RsmB/NOP family class I SAM-dependent RNA methyltransferase [Thermocoleostomius sinensis]|uniref:RsmB/NOP family class I SAM-dependent RNA methyltransferase n=1 Tax=Thermocoleostomius sinensis A174 TaxID=2016057 RepID=A0A9E8ZJW4_9CYAN|nr:RsmB/NOP family class I SAM-dependent RNA methyltransferase [Thermocoleostomius sinensis]WAL62573.1 RsmB/NOP family class I SAM-dependent RNA methyltransferase [Thermocoleostomius sinensis A174]